MVIIANCNFSWATVTCIDSFIVDILANLSRSEKNNRLTMSLILKLHPCNIKINMLEDKLLCYLIVASILIFFVHSKNNNLEYIFCIQENAANIINSDICFGIKTRNNAILSSVDFLDKSPVPRSSGWWAFYHIAKRSWRQTLLNRKFIG